MGRLARLFVWRRAVGDPYDETLVLPALIVIMVMRLNTLGRLDDWTVAAAVLAAPVFAGAWLGASLGPRGQFRAILRGISVGAIVAAVSAVIYASKYPATAKDIGNLIFWNLSFCWLASIIVGAIHGVALITEKEWQDDRVRRASLRQTGRAKLAVFHHFFRLTIGAEDLKGRGTIVVLMVRMVQALVRAAPFAALLALAAKWLGITGMGAFLQNLIALFHPV